MKWVHYFLWGCTIIIYCSCSSGRVKSDIVLNEHSIHDLDSLIMVNDQYTIVFLHAPWCTYCRNMEHTTFRNPQIVNVLNQGFNFISFDGESTEPISFNGTTYRYRPHGKLSGTHELALELGAKTERLIYPSLIVIRPDGFVLSRYQTFLSSSDLLPILESVIKK